MSARAWAAFGAVSVSGGSRICSSRWPSTTAFLPRSWRGFASCSVPRFCWRSRGTGSLLAARPVAMARVVRGDRDHDSVPADSRRRAARRLLARRDTDRGSPAVRRCARDSVRRHRAGHRGAARKAPHRARRRGRAGRNRRGRRRRRARRSRRDPDLRALLRDWADDPEAPFADLDPRASMAALAIAALVLTPAAALDPPRVPSGSAIVALVVLGIFCSGGVRDPRRLWPRSGPSGRS